MKLGLSGRLTQATLHSPLTPLFLLAALAVGLLALLTIPREEEPQISVPMVDIVVDADGLRAQDAAELLTRPLEAIVKGINGVEHVYSQTRDDQVVVTARFVVGTREDDAVLRVHERIRGNYDRLPVGTPEPLIVKHGINDVAIITLTLTPKPDQAARWNDTALYDLAEKLRLELVKVDDIGLTYLAGGAPGQVRVEPDLDRLALHHLTVEELAARVRAANGSLLAGGVRDMGVQRDIVAGHSLVGLPDIGQLLLTARDGHPVYVRDVARVVIGPAEAEHRVWDLSRAEGNGTWQRTPAVTVALAKRAGANAVVVSQAILDRVQQLRGSLIPDGVTVRVTRDYGETANEKANELLLHLGIATVSIVALIRLAIGWREAVVTLVVIPVTILLTLFAAELIGYTINRVSLFALIFAIGILVDDAIVVVENIARHWGMHDGRDRVQATIDAVAEVGNPTIVATLTVVTALLPMLFVSGLMGPYMAPIPANASAAMVFSFFVAMVIAPWLMLRLARWRRGKEEDGHAHGDHADGGKLGRMYLRLAAPVVASRRRAGFFLAAVGVATVLACSLFATKGVTVKLLPFDNKSELDVVLDLPRGATLEDTERGLQAIAAVAGGLPEVRSQQIYTGTAAPFNFNGLVRHYYMRQAPELGEVQVNLAPKGDRSRSSHAIALDLRRRLAGVALPAGAVAKVVEVPPGPPVMATLLAEIYGPDVATRRAVAEKIKGLFASVPYIVDIDDSYGKPQPRLHVVIDRDKLDYYGVDETSVRDALRHLLGGMPLGYVRRGDERLPQELVVALPRTDRAWTSRLLAAPVPAARRAGTAGVVALDQVIHVEAEAGSPALFRRDGHYADMVTAELAGAFEAPIYGIFAVDDAVRAADWGALQPPTITFHGQPTDESKPTLLWDGEWEITYVTFRDMGAAFGVAILGIYILVVAQFGSFRLPLVILTPIPLTLIGIVLGHWLFGAPFTATSMIGFIALAGIIVRNSILLVDFIRHGSAQAAETGQPLRAILLRAGAVRFKPILLTALSAMIGALTILLDPIFQGLAISLLFGLASSTLLTVLVIPAIYVVLRDADKAPSVR
ncbi:efflux RND transporter permease subunit [Nitrospirillum viridazoti]|uniref:Multidrug transporter AcrB n=1 Tax=Nitrospirillum viridazoti CBAmc TaxID=1441467 RepID=A0A248K0V6_9PROT|nr:efflux RND transporter permease subunit [Nitrospirillum amazonense]ASG24048.1 multidrug transporter AcrB [Nitrospirillum amazonense CBAmc]TWB40970.1 multidrug efflux pump subunit AcrB [Nitrospirillum amazonense]